MTLKDLIRSAKLISISKHLKKEFQTIWDIVVYGSLVKGKPKPNDIDIAVILKDKIPLNEKLGLGQKIKFTFQKNIKLNLDVKVVDLLELQDNHFLARESILAESFSLINNKWLSEIFGFKSAYLFHYDLKNLTASQKKMFYYALKGRRGSKGILDRMSGEQLSDGLIKVPIEFSYEFIELLERYKIKYKINKSLFY